MNRIYQGRVSAVELAVGKNEFKSLSDDPKEARRLGDQKLWAHHELFQDAVNYYTLALVALGEGLPVEHAITKLRERMRVAWDEFPKKTPSPALSLGQSLRKWLGADSKMTFEDVCKWVQSHGTASAGTKALAIGLLCRQAEKIKPQKCSNSYWGRFCSKLKKQPNWDYSGDEIRRKTRSGDWINQLWADDAETRCGALAGELRLSNIVKCDPCAAPVTKEQGLGLVSDALLHLDAVLEKDSKEVDTKNSKKTNAWLRGRKEEVKAFCREHNKADKPNAEGLMTETKRGGGIDINKTHSAILFKAYPSAFTFAYLRAAVGKQKKKAPKKAANGKSETEEDAPSKVWQSLEKQILELGDDPIRLARDGNKPVFQAFTSLSQWKTADGGAAWSDIDKCAFEESLKTLNQYAQKSEDRDKRRMEVKAELNFMLGVGDDPNWKPKASAEEEDRNVPVLAGDPRYGKLIALLKTMDVEREERASGEIIGPTQAALRGFGKLRAEWMDLLRKTDGEPKEADLQEAVTNLQREHKLDMGHTDFFLKLCERENWDIWRDATDEEAGTQTANRWAKSVVYAAADAQELADELVRLNEAIRYTPAEPEYSRRLFMFSDIKNKEATKHVGPGVVDVCVAAKNVDGKLAPQRIRVIYGAPRMVRDEIADGMSSKWLQPMMKALSLDAGDHGKLKKETAIALMPDWVGRKRQLHFLLNFPVDIDTDALTKKLGKLARWDKQMNAAWEKNKLKQRFHILWDGMEKDVKDSQIPAQWWWNNPDIQRDGFTCLSIDMSQRRAADFALLETSPHRTDDSFVTLGEAGGLSWHTRIWKYADPSNPKIKVAGVGSMRLPGEDAEVFRLRTKQDEERRPKQEATKNQKDFREELWGSKGRNSSQPEYNEAIGLARKLLHAGEKAENWLGESHDSYSFPEQNDKLVRLFLGALSRYRTWHRWSWRLKLEHEESWLKTFKEIAKLGYFPKRIELAKLEENQTPKAASALELQRLVADEAGKLRDFLQEALLKIASRIVPLRDNTWRWIGKPDTQAKPLHQLLADGEKPEEKPFVRGQRGLSLARIEQLEDFRRSILSLNRLLRHPIGEKPDFGTATRGDALPDPCSVLTDKIVRMKEERVNKTAHMIVAQALGVRLKAPGTTDEDCNHREAENIHGEYECIPGRQPVDFIVLEDLSRYTTDKSRARSENSRLMKWCHRAINEKVKMLTEPFGIPVLEVFAAYTSKFDARTGEPGFRAGEACASDRPRWKQAITKNPENIGLVFDQLDELAARGIKNARLLIPQQGGALFIAAIPIKDTDSPKSFPKIRQADINAAVNIGLRAIGGPQCYHAHPRVRIEMEGAQQKGRKSGKISKRVANPSGKWLTRRDNKREKAQFVEAYEVGLKLSDDSTLLKDGTATLTHDPRDIAKYGRATIEKTKHPKLVHQAAIFSRQKNERGQFTGAIARLEWEICRTLNATRLRAWGVEVTTKQAGNAVAENWNEDDKIPMDFPPGN